MGRAGLGGSHWRSLKQVWSGCPLGLWSSGGSAKRGVPEGHSSGCTLVAVGWVLVGVLSLDPPKDASPPWLSECSRTVSRKSDFPQQESEKNRAEGTDFSDPIWEITWHFSIH